MAARAGALSVSTGPELEEILVRTGFGADRLYRVLEEPADLVLVEAPGAKALEDWQRLLDLVPETGRWPVIVGDMEEAFLVFDHLVDFDPARTLADSRGIDPPCWGAELRASDPDLYSPFREDAALQDRVFRETEARRELLLHLDVANGRPVDRVGIVLVPTPRSWEAPAWLNYGGWNECPKPEVHVAFLRCWHERFGTEVASIGPETMELLVARPVAGREEALALADEQFLYCYDLVTQGTETLDRLAAHLIGATVWYFWWD